MHCKAATLLPLLLLLAAVAPGQCVLLRARILRVEESALVTLEMKFKFVDVQMAPSTAKVLRNASITSRTDIPSVPINSSARLDRKYRQLESGVSLYLFIEVLSPTELRVHRKPIQSFFEQQSTNKIHPLEFFVVPQQYRKLVPLDNNRICFVGRPLQAGQEEEGIELIQQECQ
jgi:hypothetical protein